MSVVDFGEFDGDGSTELLVENLTKAGLRHAVVAEVPFVSHWWLLEGPDGAKVLYAGTPETFRKWQRSQVQ